jgi:hypothetical protein
LILDAQHCPLRQRHQVQVLAKTPKDQTLTPAATAAMMTRAMAKELKSSMRVSLLEK